MCKVLGVQRSGYYAWKKRPMSNREEANLELLSKIREAFEISRHTYGSLRIQHYWRRQGYAFSRYRIARLMKKDQLVPLRVLKWHPQRTKQRPGARTAPNLLQPGICRLPSKREMGRGISPILIQQKAGCILPHFLICIPVVMASGGWLIVWTRTW